MVCNLEFTVSLLTVQKFTLPQGHKMCTIDEYSWEQMCVSCVFAGCSLYVYRIQKHFFLFIFGILGMKLKLRILGKLSFKRGLNRFNG